LCENGINIPQMRLSIGQVDDAVALSEQWLEQLHHVCDHGHKHETSVALAQASVLLGEARAKLEDALAGLEGTSASSEVTVELL
jgi:hypothetical protein